MDLRNLRNMNDEMKILVVLGICNNYYETRVMIIK